MRVVAVLFACLLSLGTMSDTFAQVVYKWVDDEGVTHFSAQPPRGVDAERTSIRLQNTYRPTPQAQDQAEPTAAQNAAAATRRKQQNEQAADNKIQAKNEQKIRAENCAEARTRLEKYTTARRLYREQDDGERNYLTDDELDNARVEAQQRVNDWCD